MSYGFFAWPDLVADSQQVFYANAPTTSGQGIAQCWSKPRGARLVSILAIAGGGSGGGGGVSGATAGGAGAGGGGAACLWTVSAWLLPDLLYVSVGQGGASAISGGAGNAGGPVMIGASPNLNAAQTAQNIIYLTGGSGGATGGTSGGGGGSGGSASSSNLITIGTFTQYTGQAGSSGGGSTSSGTNNFFPNNVTNPFVAGGTGAGGCNGTTDQTGGNLGIPVAGGYEPINQNISGGSTGGGRGVDGFSSFRRGNAPFYSLGGTGGGSNHAGTGGAGGNGSFGAGGGGGGGSNTTGGAGGRGGDGLVIISVT